MDNHERVFSPLKKSWHTLQSISFFPRAVRTGWLIALATAIACGPAWAQEEDAVPYSPPEDPAVQAVLESNPTTPTELTRAAKILVGLQRPDLAKGFLQKVLAAGLDQKQLAALQAQLGSTVFVQMASRDDLAPEGRQLAEAVLTAANIEAADPARLAQLVKQLRDPSAEMRYRAMDGLRRARGAAVGPLMAVLADAGRAAEHANVRAALLRLGSDAVGPLLGILEARDPKLKAEAIGVLGDLAAREAIFFLLAPAASPQGDPEVRAAAEAALLKLVGQAPSKREAASLLAQRAKRYFDAQEPLDVDVDARVPLWSWDDANKELVQQSYASDEASRLLAARFAREAYSVSPEDNPIRLLYLATMLEQAAYENGLERPLPTAAGTPAATAAEFGVETVQDVLAYAMEGGHVGAAAAAARILGRQAEAIELLYQGPRPAPLVAAARHPDRRVRFAAVEAITTLGPTMPFAGASYVADALGYFAASSGSRRALVAGPVTEESHRIGGYLAAMGYEVEPAATGRDLIRLATASPDCELALVAASLEKPTVDLLLQQLRHDFRTAGLPVAVLARSGQLDRARHIARNDPLAEAFPRPHTEEAVAAMVERLTALQGPELVAHAERRQQAAQALRWLAELISKDQKIYNFKAAEDAALAARYVPELGLEAVAVLGNLGTPTSQQGLVDLASRRTQPLELRTAAVEAFWRNTEKHGILLTPSQVLLQYDRYNRSATQDTATQQVLASILNCIEAPARLAAEGTQQKREGGSEN